MVYALIISLRAGKSISNFLREKNTVTAILMLVLNWFMAMHRITSNPVHGHLLPGGVTAGLRRLPGGIQ